MTEFLHTFHCGHTTKCEYIKPQSPKTQSFTVVYAHGFCSDPYGRKPEETKAWCLANGMGFFRYEIAGHGTDIARFEETTINVYKNQIFEIVGERKVIISAPMMPPRNDEKSEIVSALLACPF